MFLFPPRVCTVTEDQTQTVSGAPFVPVCLSRGKEGAHHPALARVKWAWEFGGIAVSVTSPLAASPPARRSRGISAAVRGSQPRHSHPARHSQEITPPFAAHPGPPFVGDHVTGPPLTQCLPARLRLNAGRIAADSSPPDRR